MLDLKFISENPDLVKAGCAKKRKDVDIDKIVKLDSERRTFIAEVDELRTRQNEVSKQIPQKSDKEKEEFFAEMKTLKENLKIKEQELDDLVEVLDELVIQVPNPPFEEVPEGKDDEDNQIVRTFSEPTKFDFDPKDHMALALDLDLLDMEKAAEASGARFYYVKNDLVLMEFALIQYALSKITAKGFKPILPPALVREHAMVGTGFFPADKNEIYSVNPEDDI